jgi:hypothetical protein
MTPMRVQHGEGAALEGSALDDAREGIATLRPTPHEGTQHDGGVLLEGPPEHRRDGQHDVPRDDPLVQHVADWAAPGVGIHFGAASAQGGWAAQRHHRRAVAAVHAAVLTRADLGWMATGQHRGHQLVILRGLRACMGLLEGLPVLGKNLREDTAVPWRYGKHPHPPSEG